jgi:hypothetical protein
MVQSLPKDYGRKLSFLLQSSVLAVLGFSPARVFPPGCTPLVAAIGDLGGHKFPALRVWKATWSNLYKIILGWRVICSR